MKKLKLQNEVFKMFVINYKEWLDILGYAESTVYQLPNHLQEFFYYAEQHHIKNTHRNYIKNDKRILQRTQRKSQRKNKRKFK